MIVHLKRFSYASTETEGVMYVDHEKFATIERPWIPNPNGSKGGKPSESCIPDGMYSMQMITRPNGSKAFAIWNTDLGVFRNPSDHPISKGRDLILVHVGNTVQDVIGCIAPGLQRHDERRGVMFSRDAMTRLIELLGDGLHILSITNQTGAKE